jgi:RNA polymerase sigma-70 factor (ECF subfamily)
MGLAWRARMTPATEAEPERLARAAARGDQEAARALLTALLPRVRNLARYLVRRDSETDDAAQEALVAVLRGLPTYRGEGTIVSWADRVAARAVFRHLRQTRRHPELALVELPPAPASQTTLADEYLLRRRAVAILDALPTEQRHVVVLHHVLEMTVPEIARELEVPAETVRSRLRLARARLHDRGVEIDGDGDSGQDLPTDERGHA